MAIHIRKVVEHPGRSPLAVINAVGDGRSSPGCDLQRRWILGEVTTSLHDLLKYSSHVAVLCTDTHSQIVTWGSEENFPRTSLKCSVDIKIKYIHNDFRAALVKTF